MNISIKILLMAALAMPAHSDAMEALKRMFGYGKEEPEAAARAAEQPPVPPHREPPVAPIRKEEFEKFEEEFVHIPAGKEPLTAPLKYAKAEETSLRAFMPVINTSLDTIDTRIKRDLQQRVNPFTKQLDNLDGYFDQLKPETLAIRTALDAWATREARYNSISAIDSIIEHVKTIPTNPARVTQAKLETMRSELVDQFAKPGFKNAPAQRVMDAVADLNTAVQRERLAGVSFLTPANRAALRDALIAPYTFSESANNELSKLKHSLTKAR